MPQPLQPEKQEKLDSHQHDIDELSGKLDKLVQVVQGLDQKIANINHQLSTLPMSEGIHQVRQQLNDFLNDKIDRLIEHQKQEHAELQEELKSNVVHLSDKSSTSPDSGEKANASSSTRLQTLDHHSH
ncbi:hypothetical protein PCASD_25182 [Puccinia coronata f. sp. avenae]|uniref:Uncharacterized protein n=1 Tax=Puccinia coronata f. sp. avenae TaxID=200324 RepID=A0A2N5SJ48_9BASI|nr:hypothetical protein PCASD_25182 [Puccinia coronata f. sp. avenae]